MGAEQGEPQRLLGDFIRAQRQMANLSLRQLSALTEVSNPYLSQVERGLHAPSVRVLRSIADALNVSAETLFEQAGLIDHTAKADEDEATEAAIKADRRLTESQRRALLSVYRSYVEANDEAAAAE
jgi:transcriptional regulator with XRE-family HTH domain